MTIPQQGTIEILQTDDGGEITLTSDGFFAMGPGLGSAAYLSLFGGNRADNGVGELSAHTWWGNVDENIPARQYRSETQYLLQSLPAIPVNLRRLEQAARRDLQWFLDTRAASGVEVAASIPAVNRVRLKIGITAVGELQQFAFTANWEASA